MPIVILNFDVLCIVYFKINHWLAIYMNAISQMLGYGFAGIFMKFLVNNPYMWYPFTLVDVFLYRYVFFCIYIRSITSICTE